ncbi:signal peptidase I [Microbacterium testaceum StLB037]|uniref:Signal peptidase I n=1 Tax=Microbacterium testaceum (strain StLB037) TaxID=979556 RepID=E8NFG4_MICTS|nr:signal peptidase I [Microbacterium testaceum StLB037]
MNELVTASRPVAAHAADSRHRSSARASVVTTVTPIERVRDAVTTFVGCLGILIVAWLVASAVWGLGIIVFVTGSMSPTLPTGAAAITRTVDAADLAVGDVVTVRRPGNGAQVTHRIVEIAPVAGDPQARSLTLRGDANDSADLRPYIVTSAPRVLIGAPLAGSIITAAKTPAAMLGGSVLIAAVIAWALWPPSTRTSPDGDEPAPSHPSR